MQKYLLYLYILLWGTGLVAQEATQRSTTRSRLDGRQTASRYIFSASSDALLMTVKIWGEVKQPGLYDIPIGTDLIELISSAGGPTDNAKLSKIKLIHAVPDSITNQLVFEIDVKEFLESGDIELIPEIKPNDTIIVQTKPSKYLISWSQQILSFVSGIALVQYYIDRTRR